MTAKELSDILSNEKVTRFGGTITITGFPLPVLDGTQTEVPKTPPQLPPCPEEPAAGSST